MPFVDKSTVFLRVNPKRSMAADHGNNLPSGLQRFDVIGLEALPFRVLAQHDFVIPPYVPIVSDASVENAGDSTRIRCSTVVLQYTRNLR